MSSSSRHQDERHLSLLAKDQYFREMKRIPPLCAEQEQRYLHRFARGQWEQRQAHPNQWRLSLARDARDRLVEAYQPLVVHFALHYHATCFRLEVLDLIQEGNVGLLRALDHNDPHDPHPFRSLAGRCIRHAILDALLEQDHLIRVTERFHRRFLQVRDVERRLQVEQGHDPSLSEVAQAMQTEEAEVRTVFDLARRQEVESLQALIERFDEGADESVLHLIGLYEPAPGLSTEQQVILREQLAQAVRQLSERHRNILTWRYGLAEEATGQCSTQEVAQRLGCHPDSVREAETYGCKRLATMLHLVQQSDGVPAIVANEGTLVPGGEPPWYTRQEVAHLLGCSLETVRLNVRAGVLPTLRVAGQRGKVYPKAAIDRLVAERQEQAA